jgi:hypothetical protein
VRSSMNNGERHWLGRNLCSIMGFPARPRQQRPPPGRPSDPSICSTSSPRARLPQISVVTEPLMTNADIARQLSLYRRDPRYRGRRRVPFRALASMCQLSHETVYQAQRGVMSEATQHKLSKIITEIEEAGLRFRRVGQEWRWQVVTKPKVT